MLFENEPKAGAGVVDMPKASFWNKLGASRELDVTGRCVVELADPRVRKSEKLNRRPPGVVTVPFGVKPKPGVAGERKMGRRSWSGIGIDMLAMASALDALTDAPLGKTRSGMWLLPSATAEVDSSLPMLDVPASAMP